MTLTKQQQIEAIRAACVAANPEIVELKFGCAFLWKEKLNDKEEYAALFENWKSRTDDTIRCLMTLGQQGIVEKSHIVKILGRPIHLADILLAMWIGEFDSEAALKIEQEKVHQLVVMWNLRKDSLEDQSPETISFIHHLLTP